MISNWKLVVEDLGLLGGQVFDDAAAEEAAADDAVAFAQEKRFQGYVVAMGPWSAISGVAASSRPA